MNRHQRRVLQKQSGTLTEIQLSAAAAGDFRSAIELMKSGRWQESEAAHRRVLEKYPRHAQTLHHLGLIAFKTGRPDAAIETLREALDIFPGYHEARLNLSVLLKIQGARAEALEHCQRVAKSEPENAAAHAELGNILKDMGDPSGAAANFRRALELRPDFPAIGMPYAQCLFELGDLSAGVIECRRILKRDPADLKILRLLIRSLAAAGRVGDALIAVEQAADARGMMDLLPEIAIGMHKTGRTTEATGFLRQAISKYPDAAELYICLGAILRDAGLLQESFDELKRGLDRDPGRADGYVILGTVLYGQGAVDGAVTSLRHAVSLRPEWTNAHSTLGAILQMSGRLVEAQQAFSGALECDPRALDIRVAQYNVRRNLCDWENLDSDEAVCLSQLRAGNGVVAPFHLLGMEVTNEDMRACGERYSRMISQRCANGDRAKPYTTFVKESDRIRIGYLSSDFGNHATSILLAEVLEKHDRSRFEIVAYCHSPDDGSALRQRVISACDRFVTIRDCGHAQAASIIRSDGIEILVDLKGYTNDARQEILALRPAPIQVNYLGYPATTGADYLDYIVADPIVAPMEHQPYYSERIVHIGPCYQPNDSQRQFSSRRVTRRECGLPDDGFVFCSFNNNFKINQRFFKIWMRLLDQVPGSVFWLLQKNPQVRTHLEKQAASFGIDPARLVFADTQPIDQHLARHAAADLFLDSLPCSAHTTASDCVWAGLPLLTCLGTAFAGRVAASVLTASNLPELIAASLDDYEAMALRLARNQDQLQALKARLVENRSTMPLYDTPRYVRSLESAFQRMSQIYRSGGAPESFAATSRDETLDQV